MPAETSARITVVWSGQRFSALLADNCMAQLISGRSRNTDGAATEKWHLLRSIDASDGFRLVSDSSDVRNYATLVERAGGPRCTEFSRFVETTRWRLLSLIVKGLTAN